MSENRLMVSTISELQIWIEGKFDLITQSQKTTHDDLTSVRSRLHDLATELTKVTALNLPERLSRLESTDKQHQESIERFSKDAAERQGMIAALKAIYAVGGTIVGFIAALLFMIYKGGIA